jgi:hypothetical protein
MYNLQAQCCSSGLWAGWSVVRVPAEAGNFSLHHRVQTGSGAHPASYPLVTRGSFPGGEADHSPPSSVEVKNAWSYTSTPHHTSMTWCSVKAQWSESDISDVTSIMNRTVLVLCCDLYWHVLLNRLICLTVYKDGVWHGIFTLKIEFREYSKTMMTPWNNGAKRGYFYLMASSAWRSVQNKWTSQHRHTTGRENFRFFMSDMR